MPALQYHTIVWAGSNKSMLKDMVTTQKRAVRCICQRKAMTHSDPFFKIFGVMKINDIYTHQVSSFMYKYVTDQLY